MQAQKPIAVMLVRDKDGKPIFDLPLNQYPTDVRDAILRQLTEEEKKVYAA